MDRYTETTRVGYFSRIKSSIGGFFFGILIIIGAIYLLAWNEGRFVETRSGLSEGEKTVITIDATSPGSTQGLVHFDGVPTGEGELSDTDFSIQSDALKLNRVVEVYQWVEKKETSSKDNLGGSETQQTTYSYDTAWESQKINSKNFKYPEGHQNPEGWQYSGKQYEKDNIQIGTIALGSEFTAKLNKTERLEIGQISPTLTEKNIELIASENTFYVGGKKTNPEVGDMRVYFEVVRPELISVVGSLSDGNLSKYYTKNSTDIALLGYGKLSAEEMFAKAHSLNKLILWGIRIGGIVLLALGFNALLNPLVILAKIIPFVSQIIAFGTGTIAWVLATLVGTLTIAIAWFYVRPLLSLGIFLGGCAVAGAIWYWKKQKQLSSPQ